MLNHQKIQTPNRNRIINAIRLLSASIFIFAVAWLIISLKEDNSSSKISDNFLAEPDSATQTILLAETVIPQDGFTLPIDWSGLGPALIETGVINKDAFTSLYKRRGGLTPSELKLLTDPDQTKIIITRDNASIILNLLWAFGLGNKSPILEEGLMATFDGQTPSSKAELLNKASRFASTGGWNLANGSTMDHYSAHSFVVLNEAEWDLVEKVARGIYRPCCDNATHFPDCNHGLAMLGLLELMAAQGATEAKMYETALQVNAYWFPETYLTIAKYFQNFEGLKWSKVAPATILGYDYSSGSGYNNLLSKINPVKSSGGGSCGV